MKVNANHLAVVICTVISENAYPARECVRTLFAVSTHMLRRMSTGPRETKEWLLAVAKHLNLSPSALALEAGAAASTLTRYLNDKTGTVGISERTLQRVSEFSGFPIYQFPGQRRPLGLAEPEVQPYDPGDGALAEPVREAVKALIAGQNGRDAWVMKGWSLELAGVMPGDIVVIDQNRRPKMGDVVCVQISDWNSGTAETVMRIYKPPFVMVHSAKLGLQQPEAVDDDRVAIRGVCVATLRARH